MITPYDASLRLRQREMDAMRVSITAEVDQVTALDGHRDAIDTAVRSEIALAAEHSLPTHAFVARMRAEREALCRQRAISAARLSALRAEAMETYGSLSAIGAAADRHRTEAIRAAAITEQSQIDDFSAARFTRTLAAARRLRDVRGDRA